MKKGKFILWLSVGLIGMGISTIPIYSEDGLSTNNRT